jgi:hypothetical protein
VKLGEALALRADMHSRQSQLAKAIEINARYQEGETPPENAKALLAEALKIADELAALCTRINLTNAATALGDGTLTSALAKRDALRAKQKLLTDAMKASGKNEYRYSYRSTKSELKDIIALDVPAMRQQQSDIAAELRELDNQIQQAGWVTDIIE